MTRISPLVGAIALGGLTAAALAGCSTGTTTSTAATDFRVVATTTQVGDFVREIVGDTAGVEVYQMLQPGAGSHEYDPSASDLVALSEADVVVENGVEMEAWLPDAITSSASAATLVDSSTGVTLREGDEEGDEHAHEDEHADDDHAEEEHAEDEHAHGEHDPHIWQSVANAEIMVGNIRDALVEADPANAADYEANASAYLDQLTALDAWITESVDQVPAADRLLVTNHDALGYYVDAYGLVYVGAVIPSLDDNAETSAAEIDELVHLIEETGAPAVFGESSINAAAAETIAAEAGVQVYAGDDALYGDALGADGTDGATYIGSMVHNTDLIVESWGAADIPLPEALAAFAPADAD